MSVALHDAGSARPQPFVADGAITLRGSEVEADGLVLSTATIWSRERMLVALLPGSAAAVSAGGGVDHDGFYEHDAEPVRGLNFDARFLVPVAPQFSIDATVAVRDGRRYTSMPVPAPTAVTVSGPLVAVLEVMHGLTPSLSTEATFSGDMVALALYLGWLSGSHAYRQLFPSRASVRHAFTALAIQVDQGT